MDMKEIEKKVALKQKEFQDKKFFGKLPANLLEVFKKAFMNVAPYQHKVPAKAIQDIVAKKVNELSNADVRTVLNLITLAEPCKIYKDYKEAESQFVITHSLIVDFNITNAQEEQKLTEYKKSLIQLSGIDIQQKRSTLYQA